MASTSGTRRRPRYPVHESLTPGRLLSEEEIQMIEDGMRGCYGAMDDLGQVTRDLVATVRELGQLLINEKKRNRSVRKHTRSTSR